MRSISSTTKKELVWAMEKPDVHEWGDLDRLGREADGARIFGRSCSNCEATDLDDNPLRRMPCWVVQKYLRADE